MKTKEQKLKSLNIFKKELNNKLIDIENGSSIGTMSQYDDLYRSYIETDKKIESLMAGV